MTGVHQAVTCLQVHSRLLVLARAAVKAFATGMAWHYPSFKDLRPLSWQMVLHLQPLVVVDFRALTSNWKAPDCTTISPMLGMTYGSMFP